MMLSFSPNIPSRPLPKRNDSLTARQVPSPSASNAAQEKLYVEVNDDLRDARRVLTHGQEEDLKAALSKVMTRVTELVSALKQAQRASTELETALNVSRSNLQLLIANNEMLEEALSRSSGTRDVGWRRWSAKEGTARDEREREGSGERPRSMDQGATSEEPRTDSPVSPVAASPVLPSASDSRFFKFRFSGSKTPTDSAGVTPIRSRSPASGGTASLGSLSVPSRSPSISDHDVELHRDKELLKELRSQKEALELERTKEQEAREKAEKDKAALEAEIESLSQALFEEANKMVAQERIRRAEAEEELREVRIEKEALKSALRIVEGENGRLRTDSLTSLAAVHSSASSLPDASSSKSSLDSGKYASASRGSRPSSPEGDSASRHSHASTSSLSSRTGVKSPVPRSSAPSPEPHKILEAVELVEEQPSASTIRPSSPPLSDSPSPSPTPDSDEQSQPSSPMSPRSQRLSRIPRPRATLISPEVPQPNGSSPQLIDEPNPWGAQTAEVA